MEAAKQQPQPTPVAKKEQRLFKCDVCNIQYTGTESEISSHIFGKKHKERLRLLEDASKQVLVHVSIPDHQRIVFKQFLTSTFGCVEKIYFNDLGRRFVSVTFKSLESVTKAINSRHIFDNKKLNFEKRNITLRQVKKKEKKQRPLPQPRFILTGAFEEQIRELIKKVERSPEKSQEIQSLYSELQNCLMHEYPDCRVVPFGSVITGLAFTDSDVDCFVSINPIQMQILMSKCDDIDLLHSRLVRNTKNILHKYKTLFSHIVGIPRASVPIVKCLHIKSQTNCDVSFKNGFGIYNSRLIFFFIASDPRLKTLLQFIKYWAKNHDFLGYKTFSSYALTMLIIYYLQQISPPILIPIKELQKDKKFDIYIDGWNCGFDGISALPKTQNTSSVLTLLQGFYHFYEDYDFANNVICPYVGKSFPIEAFNNLENLLPSFQTYVNLVKVDRSKNLISAKRNVFVQDPFEHTRNITNTPDNKLKFFKSHCKLAYTKITNSIENNTYDNLINTLLNQQIATVKNNSSNILVKFPKMSNSDIDKSSLVNSVKIVVENILTEMLKCNFEIDNDEVCTEKNVTYHSVNFKCQTMYNVWFARKLHTENLSATNNALLKEIEITNALIDSGYKNISPKNPLFSFNFTVNIFDDNLKFSIRLIDGDKREYNIFFSFLNSRMSKILNPFFSNLIKEINA
ncbi:speckle targeted PIP5K1A-regulated poly(A) polymerase-like isoform X1 [Arctopsyche grandis]|uniref:speckle targeted PIP5K1A-regulated poly(A) polymerase-like isoform X1 n=1 Tax=Arctopsyche grandis TaxID=121162 RepID=UPI00406D6438